jgi:fatty acid desaturase
MHKPAKWMRDVVALGGEYHWTRMDAGRHNLLNLVSATLVWGSVFGLLALGRWMPAAVWIPLAGVLIACMLFAHYILILHECSHNMFVLLKDREQQKKLNRFIGIVAGGMMFTDYLQHWEKGHTIHHLRPCEEDDPQDKNPITGKALYAEYAKLVFVPFYFLAINPSNQYGFSIVRLLGGLAFWAPVFTATWLWVGWAAPVALYIAFAVLMMLNMTKKAQEHGCGLENEEFRILRSRTYHYPTAFLTSPFNINYHFEHHANFNVPWYKLPEYHTKLKEMVPAELHPYYFHRDFFLQLSGNKPLPTDDLRPLTWAAPEEAPAK